MQKKEEHMGKHKALQGAIAAFASVATLGALAVPALADSASTYSPNGKSVAELAQHGGAQRIAAIGNKSAKNVVLFIGDGMATPKSPWHVTTSRVSTAISTVLTR